MKVTSNVIAGITYVNIYASTEEMNEPCTLSQIKQLKEQYGKVAIFTSGNKPYMTELIRVLKV